ncbi:M42 family metallopeptidase [Ignavibacteria bacterium]|jgi:putative aminopeptidase FrvX|nr:M42 family metallopeptidase [Bacteroidota bacterium]
MNSYETLKKLIEIDSPSGFTGKATEYITDLLKSYGWQPEYTKKGAVRCKLGEQPKLAIAAHTDTLGAIVSGINSNGTLAVSKIGGPLLPSFEGGYVRIHTLDGHIYEGTLMLNNPSAHANNEAEKKNRTAEAMHIRLDENVKSAADVRALIIRNGDFICFDPRYCELPNGYIKSHFLDNKAGCYVLFEIARKIAEAGRTVPVELFFSTYEEVGHGGAAGYSPSIEKMLTIDMGVLGDQCEGDETSCSICAKDSSGPYDYEFRKTLVNLAEYNNISYKLDIYPYYSSDGTAAQRAGQDVRVALIGPGVAGSHGAERTHKKGIEATIDLCMAYIDTL